MLAEVAEPRPSMPPDGQARHRRVRDEGLACLLPHQREVFSSGGLDLRHDRVKVLVDAHFPRHRRELLDVLGEVRDRRR
eukprot:3035994-Heterocapsa_arctica.AAC.1